MNDNIFMMIVCAIGSFSFGLNHLLLLKSRNNFLTFQATFNQFPPWCLGVCSLPTNQLKSLTVPVLVN